MLHHLGNGPGGIFSSNQQLNSRTARLSCSFPRPAGLFYSVIVTNVATKHAFNLILKAGRSTNPAKPSILQSTTVFAFLWVDCSLSFAKERLRG